MFTIIKAHIARYGLGLVTALHPQSSPLAVSCEATLLTPAGVIAGTLTPSPWILKGDDLALRLIAGDQTALDGYRSDPRFIALGEGRRADITNVSNQLPMGTHGSEIQYYLDSAEARNGSPARLIPTWAEMGVRAINRLIDRRLYVVGLIAAPVHADGRRFDEVTFVDHDLGHAEIIEKFRMGKGLDSISTVGTLRSRAFDEAFRYDDITRGMSPRDHLLFDLAYFDFFHETLAISGWTITLASLDSSVTDETLTAKCRSLHKVNDRLVERFLNPKDLRTNLPLEVKSFVKAHPERGEEVIRRLLEAAYAVFIPFQVEASRAALDRHPNVRD